MTEKILTLDDWGDCLRVEKGNLVYGKLKIQPLNNRLKAVVISTRRGFITFEAVRWLSVHEVPTFFLNFKGELETQFAPVTQKTYTTLKLKQIQAYLNSKVRQKIAAEFVRAKIENSEKILRELGIRTKLSRVENMAAWQYWSKLASLFNVNGFHFDRRQARSLTSRRRASDEINSALNYSYQILAGLCRQALISRGFILEVGFLHNIGLSKTPLVYDFQELGRADIDGIILNMVRSRELKPSDFGRRYDYVSVIESKEARFRLIERIEGNAELKCKINTSAQRLEQFLLKGRGQIL